MEKRTLKTLALSREAKTRYRNVNRAAKNKVLTFIPWLAAALNAIYKANQSTNSPFKLEIVLKLAHLLGHLKQTTNSCTLNHPISDHALLMQDHDVTTQIWGLNYTQIWSKMQILEGYAEFESFAYIVRHYESAVEATSLLSSVTSLAIRVCVGISANTPQNRISPR